MANNCYTTYIIEGAREQVKKVYDTLSALEPNASFVRLSKVAEAFGIDWEGEGICVRGEIISCAWYEEGRVISIDTDTAWTGCHDLFYAIIEEVGEEYLSLSYRETEPGCEVFNVHDEGEWFPEVCAVTSQGLGCDDYWGDPFATLDDAIDEWCRAMEIPRDQSKSTKEYVEYINSYEYEDEDMYYNIHEFTFV